MDGTAQQAELDRTLAEREEAIVSMVLKDTDICSYLAADGTLKATDSFLAWDGKSGTHMVSAVGSAGAASYTATENDFEEQLKALTERVEMLEREQAVSQVESLQLMLHKQLKC
jgi:hypothetical protein